eukprot:scaffold185729_cov30-Attheya_sp.AAC.1
MQYFNPRHSNPVLPWGGTSLLQRLWKPPFSGRSKKSRGGIWAIAWGTFSQSGLSGSAANP